MNISFFNGVSGLMAYQKDMDVLAHNMANVNTVGFKSQRTSFEELLSTQMDTNSGQLITGHGVRAASTQLMYTQGSPYQTNSPMDFAIVGQGLFAVEHDGTVEYTRNGRFGIRLDGKNGYLVSSDGGYILDAKGRRIKLERQGEDHFDTTHLAERVGVYQFPNPFGLTPTNGGSFLATETSGKAYVPKVGDKNAPSYTLIQSALESSNLELSEEMVNLITTQRAYQMNAKMVQTADQIEEIVNNLR